MKEIIINYTKDRNTPNDYIVKRVIRQYDDLYDLTSFFMINNKIVPYPSKLPFNEKATKRYIEECKKSKHFKSIIEQEVLF